MSRRAVGFFFLKATSVSPVDPRTPLEQAESSPSSLSLPDSCVVARNGTTGAFLAPAGISLPVQQLEKIATRLAWTISAMPSSALLQSERSGAL